MTGQSRLSQVLPAGPQQPPHTRPTISAVLSNRPTLEERRRPALAGSARHRGQSGFTEVAPQAAQRRAAKYSDMTPLLLEEDAVEARADGRWPPPGIGSWWGWLPRGMSENQARASAPTRSRHLLSGGAMTYSKKYKIIKKL